MEGFDLSSLCSLLQAIFYLALVAVTELIKKTDALLPSLVTSLIPLCLLQFLLFHSQVHFFFAPNDLI